MHNTGSDIATCSSIKNVPVFLKSDKKIIDLITDRMRKKAPFFSIEVSPNSNLQLNYTDFKKLPLFTAITWMSQTNLKSSRASLLDAAAIKLGIKAAHSSPILQHLTCGSLKEQHVDELVSANVGNILALTGDTTNPGQDFQRAIDLVKAIRRKAGNQVSIAVAGYPDVHPTAVDAAADVRYLKEKVDAGADFIITQIVFTSDLYFKFLKKSRASGIQVPILPGICLPKSYKELQVILKLTSVSIPQAMITEYGKCAESDSLFQTVLIENTAEMVRQLFDNDADLVCGVHFFTLNNLELLNEVLLRLESFGITF